MGNPETSAGQKIGLHMQHSRHYILLLAVGDAALGNSQRPCSGLNLGSGLGVICIATGRANRTRRRWSSSLSVLFRAINTTRSTTTGRCHYTPTPLPRGHLYPRERPDGICQVSRERVSLLLYCYYYAE